jgi:hypothetical protein
LAENSRTAWLLTGVSREQRYYQDLEFVVLPFFDFFLPFLAVMSIGT